MSNSNNNTSNASTNVSTTNASNTNALNLKNIYSSGEPKWAINNEPGKMGHIVTRATYSSSNLRIAKPLKQNNDTATYFRIHTKYVPTGGDDTKESSIIIGSDTPLDFFSWGVSLPKGETLEPGKSKYKVDCFMMSKKQQDETDIKYREARNEREMELRKYGVVARDKDDTSNESDISSYDIKTEDNQYSMDDIKAAIQDINNKYNNDERIINGLRLVSQVDLKHLIETIENDILKFLILNINEWIDILPAKHSLIKKRTIISDIGQFDLIKTLIWKPLIREAETDEKGEKLRPKFIRCGPAHKKHPNQIVTKFYDLEGNVVMPSSPDAEPLEFMFDKDKKNFFYIDTAFIFDNIFLSADDDKMIPISKIIDATVIPIKYQPSNQRRMVKPRRNNTNVTSSVNDL